MTKRVQRYRVTSTVMATLVGLVGEMVVNLTNNSVHVHDGVTEGGFELGLANVSNVQQATTSQAGKMSAAQVTQLDAATAANVANAAAIAQEIIDRTAADAVIAGTVTTANTAITNLNAGKFALNTEPVLLSFYQSTIPTGWTLNTSFDDRVPIVESTQGEGANTGGTWTISGLTANSHTHGFTPAGTIAASSSWTQGSGVAPGSNGYYWSNISIPTFSFTGSAGTTGGPSTTGVTHTPGWRPNFVKVLVLSRSSWSA
jgi:hypothetical protein